jgi:type VI secretion system secreted protein VgrG
MPELPSGAMQANKLVLERRYHDDEPLAGAPYEITFADGSSRTGKLDGSGRAILEGVPAGAAEVRFGAMPGTYERKDLRPTPGHKPNPSKSDIDALIEKFSTTDKGA